ncbi:MAG: class I SAM-dependent methyltransferase [Acidimicrobiales bacterium]
MTSFACRFCSTPLEHRVVDLGMSPLCESFLPADALDSMEPFYPLNVWVCHECFLVQLNEYVDPGEIFEEYAYFSSFATTWLQHAADYVEMISKRLELGADSMVVELASNDGYLLKNFVEAGIPCLGIEPAANVAKSAVEIGVPTDVSFFGKEKGASLAADGVKADLVLGNNVMAQVPDLNDFIAGIPEILKPTGTVTIEFPHLLQLLEQNQFDTIYHEHYCYFSLVSTEKIFAAHGLTIFDVEELWTHGGSLRIYARPNADESRPVSDAVIELRNREIEAGFLDVERYVTFEEQARETKRALLEILINAKREGKTVCGYGAPGKGNTLLNYCGIREDFLDFTVDRNPYKHGRFLPGTHIPIFTPDKIDEVKPDLILILPWNFKDEILEQMKHVREWGAQFIVPIPTATVI